MSKTPRSATECVRTGMRSVGRGCAAVAGAAEARPFWTTVTNHKTRSRTCLNIGSTTLQATFDFTLGKDGPV